MLMSSEGGDEGDGEWQLMVATVEKGWSELAGISPEVVRKDERRWRLGNGYDLNGTNLSKKDKTGQKREACRSQKKFKAVAVGRERKTKENAKRMVENAYTIKKLFKFREKKKRQGPKLQ
nr:hypothetical protein [Tanacetum cinerariifolium]